MMIWSQLSNQRKLFGLRIPTSKALCLPASTSLDAVSLFIGRTIGCFRSSVKFGHRTKKDFLTIKNLANPLLSIGPNIRSTPRSVPSMDQTLTRNKPEPRRAKA
ncbi:hypothetical protein LWI29_026080 [Acer saccharum]|uniref:Uncharacterized protein n=1 Tax=Acer saccharum TaxID=4024 RepID=A0AA39SCA7_ACESA|nr:hypothetical protein LWI29_026080 [Acer saccharum]